MYTKKVASRDGRSKEKKESMNIHESEHIEMYLKAL
jgi:hypothetical protein